MLGERLLREDAYLPPGASVADRCLYCTKNASLPLYQNYCNGSAADAANCTADFLDVPLRCLEGMPGFASGVIYSRLRPSPVFPLIPADSFQTTRRTPT